MGRSGGKPVVYLLAGPNGSGKSTFHRTVLSRWVPIFVNADEIAAQMSPHDVASVAWEAARLADRERTNKLSTGRDFATETVFSHPSQLDFIQEAQAAGYYVRLLFFCLESPALNAWRVKHRVSRGGHDVPTDKITGRYWRALEHAAAARNLADELWLFDDSADRQTPRRVARFIQGQLTSLHPPVPQWVSRQFGDLLIPPE